MQIGKRLLVVGILFLMLGIVIATQYAVTRTGYVFTVVHPSDANIRFIGSDLSGDGIRVLRAVNNGTTGTIQVSLGNFSAGYNKTYTAAFGIVNEESFVVNITHINVSTAGSDYLQIWLHGERKSDVGSDSGDVAFLWNKGVQVSQSTSTAWTLGQGNNDASDMDGTDAATLWDASAHVRSSTYNTTAVNGTDDYVWVQISLDLPQSPSEDGETGALFIHFEASTHYMIPPPTLSFGTPAVFESATTTHVDIDALDSTHVIIVYRDGGNSYRGTAIVGTVSGTSISFGSPMGFDTNVNPNCRMLSVSALDNTHAIISYWNKSDSNHPYAVVATISGTSISLGTSQVLDETDPNTIVTPYLSSDIFDGTHAFIAWGFFHSTIPGLVYRRAMVATISSGNVITNGTYQTFGSTGSPDYTLATVLDQTHGVVVWSDSPLGAVGTWDGQDGADADLTFGTHATLSTDRGLGRGLDTLDSTHIVLSLRNFDDSSHGYALIATWDEEEGADADLASGEAYMFENAAIVYNSVTTMDSSHFIVNYEDDADGDHGTGISGIVSDGTAISYDTPVVFEGAATAYIASCKLNSTTLVVAYQDDDNGDFGTAVVGDYS